ncbi:MAG: hypothetical protein Q9165_008254 [Trypethelium subeluteriae]
MKASMDGKLVLAPMDFNGPNLRILDSGAADGTWLYDLQRSLSSATSATFIGTDVSPERFPTKSPVGISLQLQNILDPWPQDWRNSFNLVHQRLTLGGAAANTRDAVERLLDLVKPGGWVQLIEAEQTVGTDDGPAMHQFLDLMKEIFTAMGSGYMFARKMEEWIKEAAFIRVESTLAPYEIGARIKDSTLRSQSIDSTCTAVAGLVDYARSKYPLTLFL